MYNLIVMCSDFGKVSSFLDGMSNSSSERFPVKVNDGEEEVQFEILKKPILEDDRRRCNSDATTTQSPQEQGQDASNGNYREKEDNGGVIKIERRPPTTALSLGGLKATGDGDGDEDNDGFKTPTSLDQRIPAVITQCPPAPRKPRPIKRKATSISPPRGARRRLQFDLVESLFPESMLDDLYKKMKKADEL